METQQQHEQSLYDEMNAVMAMVNEVTRSEEDEEEDQQSETSQQQQQHPPSSTNQQQGSSEPSNEDKLKYLVDQSAQIIGTKDHQIAQLNACLATVMKAITKLTIDHQENIDSMRSDMQQFMENFNSVSHKALEEMRVLQVETSTHIEAKLSESNGKLDAALAEMERRSSRSISSSNNSSGSNSNIISNSNINPSGNNNISSNIPSNSINPGSNSSNVPSSSINSSGTNSNTSSNSGSDLRNTSSNSRSDLRSSNNTSSNNNSNSSSNNNRNSINPSGTDSNSSNNSSNLRSNTSSSNNNSSTSSNNRGSSNIGRNSSNVNNETLLSNDDGKDIVLIIGDSNTDKLVPSMLHGAKHVVIEKRFRLDDAMKRIPKVQGSHRVTDVVMLTGINDVKLSNASIQANILKTDETCREYSSKFPRAKIHIGSIAPSNGKHSEYNTQLKRLANERNAPFIAIDQMYDRKSGYLKHDMVKGIHYTDAGVKILAKQIKRSLYGNNTQRSMPEANIQPNMWSPAQPDNTPLQHQDPRQEIANFLRMAMTRLGSF